MTQQSQLWMCRQRKRKWKQGEEREGGMYGESNMETYITICKTDSQWEFAIWLKELKPGPCNNLEGWDGEGGGRGGQEQGDICIPMADSCWCFAETNTILKAIILQLKKWINWKFFKKLKRGY